VTERAPGDQRTGNRRRRSDEWRAWAPLILSILTTLVVIVLAYGGVRSRLDLIEYRLLQIERALHGKVVIP